MRRQFPTGDVLEEGTTTIEGAPHGFVRFANGRTYLYPLDDPAQRTQARRAAAAKYRQRKPGGG